MRMDSMLRWILGMVLLLSYSRDAASEKKFVVSRDASSWTDAMTSCKSVGTLAILNNASLKIAFEKHVKVNINERIWIGQYVGYSPLVTVEGCYNRRSLSVDRSTQLAKNSLLNCLLECPNSMYIGMQANKCYCMRGLSTRAQFVPGMYCQNGCPGESSLNSASTRATVAQISQCGREDNRYSTVSVFRRVTRGEIQLDGNIPDQGECVAYDQAARSWKTGDCKANLKFTCSTKPCPLGPQTCVIESPQLSTWFASRTMCETNGGYLSPVNATTNIYLNNRVPSGQTLYWTGIHREKTSLWINDVRANLIGRSDICVAIVKNKDGMWTWVTDFCTKKYRFVCYQEVKEPVPTDGPNPVPPVVVPSVLPPVVVPTDPPKTDPITTTVTWQPETTPTQNPFRQAFNITASATFVTPSIFTSITSATFCFIINILV